MTPENPLYFLTQLPPKVRLWVYLVLSLASFVFMTWMAAKGNTALFVVFLMSTIGHALPTLYVPPKKPEDNNGHQ